MNNTNHLYVTILAGGEGKRMKSDLPKVLAKVRGESMIVRLLKQIIELNPDKILIVVGRHREIIRKEIEMHIESNKIIYVDQEFPLGTGDAVKNTLPHLRNLHIDNIILNGDVPMITSSTIKAIYDFYRERKSNFLITSINLENPTGNGRIIFDKEKNFSEIVEEKDCDQEQKKISLVNCGLYICNNTILSENIPLIKNSNAQKEYYLTDLVKIYRERNKDGKIDLYILPSEKEIEIYNINTKEQLRYAENYSGL